MAASLLIVFRTYVFTTVPSNKIFWNQALINVASIAIWNRNKVATALAMSVWGASVGFHLHSKSLPFVPSAEDLESHTNVF